MYWKDACWGKCYKQALEKGMEKEAQYFFYSLTVMATPPGTCGMNLKKLSDSSGRF